MVVYCVDGKALVLCAQFNLVWTELPNVETDAEHFTAVRRVIEHVVHVQFVDYSVAGITHVRWLRLEKVRPHPRYLPPVTQSATQSCIVVTIKNIIVTDFQRSDSPKALNTNANTKIIIRPKLFDTRRRRYKKCFGE